MRVETKRMLLGRSFLAAWLIACFSIAAGQTAGWFIEKSDGIFCHPCSCGTAVE